MSNPVSTTPQETRPVWDQRTDPGRGWLHPQVKIVETRDGHVLEAEMPGVAKDGLEILLEGNELTILGRRSVHSDLGQLVHRESLDRDYRRTFELDPVIDTAKITARMEDGVLTLELPKAEKVKPRKIAVE